MNPNFSFDDVRGAAEVLPNFERVWQEVEMHQDSEAASAADCDSVWLECTAELLDAASVEIVGVSKSRLGVEMLQFTCPRCNERHESLRFR